MSDLEKQASTWVPPWQRASAKPEAAQPVSNLREAAEQAAARWSTAAVAAPATEDTPDVSDTSDAEQPADIAATTDTSTGTSPDTRREDAPAGGQEAPGTEPQTVAAQPGSAAHAGATAQSGAAAQPGSAAHPGATAQSGVAAQPGTAAQSGAAAQPGSAAHAGATALPGSAAQPGTAAQSGAAAQPGSAVQPGTAIGRAAETQAGAETKPRSSLLGIRAVVDAAAAVHTLDARIGAIADPLLAPDDDTAPGNDQVPGADYVPGALDSPGADYVPGARRAPGADRVPGDSASGLDAAEDEALSNLDPVDGDGAGDGSADGEPQAGEKAAKRSRAKKGETGDFSVPEQRKAKRAAAAESDPPEQEGDEEPEYRQYDPAEFKAALEAILMVVDEPVSELVLATVMEVREDDVAIALIQLAQLYTEQGRGFDLRRAAGGWRFYTRAEYAPYVERFVLDGQQLRLTQASLETLAVVAYKQPVTRARIAAIRGVNCDGVIRTLITRGMVEECGADPDSGGHLYRTTSLFLEKMGLDSVDQLPPLAPFLPDNIEELAAGE